MKAKTFIAPIIALLIPSAFASDAALQGQAQATNAQASSAQAQGQFTLNLAPPNLPNAPSGWCTGETGGFSILFGSSSWTNISPECEKHQAIKMLYSLGLHDEAKAVALSLKALKDAQAPISAPTLTPYKEPKK